MSEEKKETAKEEQKAQPGIRIITQYLKDSSFENPHAPDSIVSGWPTPETNVQISLGQKKINEEAYESAIKIRVEAKNNKDNKITFIMDVEYAALVALSHIPEENIPAVLMVEVPKLLFPFIRELVSKMTVQGGYPPLYLAPINFEALYMEEMKRLKEQQEKETSK